ncbi:MAG: hypothetical protein LBD37_00405 [Treponema sp.]|nr:hypothetical protein [Treponema sp.]
MAGEQKKAGSGAAGVIKWLVIGFLGVFVVTVGIVFIWPLIVLNKAVSVTKTVVETVTDGDVISDMARGATQGIIKGAVAGVKDAVQDTDSVSADAKSLVNTVTSTAETLGQLVPPGLQINGNYEAYNDSGIDFLNISFNGKTEKVLLLRTISGDGPLFVYNGNSAPYFTDGVVAPLVGNWIFSGANTNWVKATSILTEGKNVFSTNKMGKTIGECWVEGAAGTGIGETLTLTLPPGFGNALLISSGFVSYEKPYLYRENARIKQLRIYNERRQSRTVELRDTPHFQPLNVDGLLSNGSSVLFLEIKEVYPGTKYEDTCVNALCYQSS